MPDADTIALIVSTLAGIWTAFQEWRHRKDKKAAAPKATLDEIMPPKPVIRGKR